MESNKGVSRPESSSQYANAWPLLNNLMVVCKPSTERCQHEDLESRHTHAISVQPCLSSCSKASYRNISIRDKAIATVYDRLTRRRLHPESCVNNSATNKTVIFS